MTAPFSLTLWQMATTALGPAIDMLLQRRAQRGKEDITRLAERRGTAAYPRPSGPVIWLHGASVGEAMSVLALIKKLQAVRSDIFIVLTTGTVASAQVLSGRLPDRVLHQFAPVDRLPWVRRFLDHWQPDLALWIESELWPNMIAETYRRKVPLVLLNGRMSEKSFRRWQRQGSLARYLLRSFDLCLAQDETQGKRLSLLGAQNVACLGNLKAGAEPLPVDDAELVSAKSKTKNRPLWLAASTHEGEEQFIAAAHLSLRETFPNILTVVAPRHPTRGAQITDLFTHAGLKVARRSQREDLNSSHDIYLGDTLGEMGLFYRLSGVTFLGGSLVAVGGHNPIEAAQLDTALIVGPFTFNFAGLISDLQQAKACATVTTADELAKTVKQLLTDSVLRQDRIGQARAVAAREAGALDRISARLYPYITRLKSASEFHRARA